MEREADAGQGRVDTRSRRLVFGRRGRPLAAARRSPLDAWGRRASEEATVILGTWSFVGRGYHDSADLAVTTIARTRETRGAIATTVIAGQGSSR